MIIQSKFMSEELLIDKLQKDLFTIIDNER